MRILYLTCHFFPDFDAGSFRNTSLVKTLLDHLDDNDCVDVMTTFPHRYGINNNIKSDFENKKNINIYRTRVPSHKNKYIRQISAFIYYCCFVLKKVNNSDYDLVFASSSKLMTAFLGSCIARKIRKPLYLDIRDIFYENISIVLHKNVFFMMPFIKIVEKITFNYADHINLISEGFIPYFEKFKCKSYSYFTHGIDDDFLNLKPSRCNGTNGNYKIIYAGNIGEGQGLEKIIPPAAELLGNDYTFLIIGDGGTKEKLLQEVKKRNLQNVKIKDPVDRNELKSFYDEADFLFVHLNNFTAFKKVLPSKIFELVAYDKPIIAGVTGFSYQFIEKHVPNVILFESCDVNDMIKKIKQCRYKNEYRTQFIEKFKRKNINNQMVRSMVEIASGINLS